MSEAGRIAVRRRKTHKGAAPKMFRCRWCCTAIEGRAKLDRHERACDHRPINDFIEVSEQDMAALAWVPQDTT
jgi:hypothetical protein